MKSNRYVYIAMLAISFLPFFCEASIGRLVKLINGMDVNASVRYIVQSGGKFKQIKSILSPGKYIDVVFPQGYKGIEWIAVDGPGGEFIGSLKMQRTCLDKNFPESCNKKSIVTISPIGLEQK